MADFSSEQIIELTKFAATVNPDIAKVVGVLVTIVSGVFYGITTYNSIVTKRNTEANNSTIKILNEHKQAMVAHAAITNREISETVTRGIKEMSTVITRAKSELFAEIDKVKIVVAKVNDAASNKLSGIPKIQDVLNDVETKIESIEKRVDVSETNLTLLVDGLKKRKAES